MNMYWDRLQASGGQSPYIVVGLMSGTSCDGLDIAVCRINLPNEGIEAEITSFETVPYPSSLHQRVRAVAFRRQVDQQELTLLHRDLGKWFGGQVHAMLERNNMKAGEVDLVASHGQTVYHVPSADPDPGATLQLGDANQLARRTGCVAVTDFRPAFTAAGLEAAPVTPHVDRLLFRSEQENRVLLNIGGIANFTWLGRKGSPEEKALIYSDTGPGNTLIDAAVRYYYSGVPHDEGGAIAGQGSVDSGLLEALLQHPFLEREPPKSTGPESFHLEWVFRVMREVGCSDLKAEDLVATLTQFTAAAIAKTLRQTVGSFENTRMFVSGGGVHNQTLIRMIDHKLPELSIAGFDELGVSPDAREALTFAVLGSQLVFGEGILVNSDAGKQRLYPGTIAFP